ncbi:TonB family protein [Aliiglaciecola sp. 3_MG-2023]|uniref:energy transducer TonB n=1 Tax=Aliiglaciecola sp. 3_MG-2023 TaxID=3062644 RepID=UPI0026E2153D|nr:TonB family protein [Aliiglaciecola sp. 3_MG-2023]MDO6694213.1 TonB family protein [Aliiglaciecola sp. 3_MG-2023]
MTVLYNYLRGRALSLLISIAMLSMALLIMWMSDWLKTQTDETLVVRTVSTVDLPPPPPPPPPQQTHEVSQTDVQLNVQGEGATLPVIEFDVKSIDLLKPQEINIDPLNTQWQSLEVDWDAVGIESLDAVPTLLTPLVVDFPKSLQRRGVTKTLVKLDVMIDEEGKVTLINVASNSYPELNQEIRKLVRKSRFSPPQKDNEPARARFIWPIEISV